MPEKLISLISTEGGLLHRLATAKLGTICIYQQKAAVLGRKEKVYSVHKLLTLATQKAREALIQVATHQQAVQEEKEQRLLLEAQRQGEGALTAAAELKSEAATWKIEQH